MKLLKKLAVLGALCALVSYIGLPQFEQEFIGDELADGNNVKMYSLASCGLCVAMKKDLAAAGIPYKEVLLDNMSSSEQGDIFEEVSASGAVNSGGVPFFKVNGTWIAHRGIRVSDLEDELFFK
jgi:glutaredoxin